MLKVLLVSNWYVWRIRALQRIARSPHRLVGVIVRPTKYKNNAAKLVSGILTRMPGGLRVSRRLLSLVFAERLELSYSARSSGITVCEFADINHPKVLNRVRELAPDVILTLGWPKKFGPELVRIARLGCINCHPSLLPRHRGYYPLSAAILARDTETGITYHFMNEEFDRGDILLQKSIPIAPRETGLTLLNKCGTIAMDSLLELLDSLEAGHPHPVPQQSENGSDAPRLSKSDGLVDWGQMAEEIDCKVRALYPWLRCQTFHQQHCIEFFACEPKGGCHGATPGEVLTISEEGLIVATGDAGLLVKEPSLSGCNKSDSRTYLQEQVKVGDLLMSKPD